MRNSTMYTNKNLMLLLFLLVICPFVRTKWYSPGCAKPPKDCSGEKITFYLYARNGDEYTERKLNVKDDSFKSNLAYLQKDAPTKVIIHGYTGSVNNQLMIDLRKAYFENYEKINIIGVDYKDLAKKPKICYVMTTFRSKKIIGKCIAELIEGILENRPDINVTSFHVIGFSFGAQIAAQLSNHLNEVRLQRITGLDPAGPLFFWPLVSSEDKLNKEHANFVDVIHTDIGDNGINDSNAHYDFYANQGKNQPECKGSLEALCSHVRAVNYFVESIDKSHKFWATKCPFSEIISNKCPKSDNKSDLVLVGEYAQKPESSKEGSYVFHTGSKTPFSQT